MCLCVPLEQADKQKRFKALISTIEHDLRDLTDACCFIYLHACNRPYYPYMQQDYITDEYTSYADRAEARRRLHRIIVAAAK